MTTPKFDQRKLMKTSLRLEVLLAPERTAWDGLAYPGTLRFDGNIVAMVHVYAPVGLFQPFVDEEPLDKPGCEAFPSLEAARQSIIDYAMDDICASSRFWAEKLGKPELVVLEADHYLD
jgi:hypothetical protein